MKITNHGAFAAQPFDTNDSTQGAKADRVAALALRAGKDTFDAAPATSWARLTSSMNAGVSPSDITARVPTLPGRTGVSELNPFDANALPTNGRGSGILAEVDASKTMGVLPMGLDQAARSAAIRGEVEAGVGNHTSPAAGPSAGDLAVDWDAVNGAMISGAIGGAATAAVGALGATAVSGGIAAPSIPVAAFGGAVTGAAVGGVVKLADELWSDYVKADDTSKKEAEAKGTAPGGAAAQPPASSTPPPEEKKADATSPDPKPASEPREKPDKVGSSYDPMRSSGRNYEAMREAYLGHADGSNAGARGTGLVSRAADPRKTNPGRDADGAGAPAGSLGPSIGERLTLIADPMRTERLDARATVVANGTRVSGRVILTDPNADDAGSPSAAPKGNGLVR